MLLLIFDTLNDKDGLDYVLFIVFKTYALFLEPLDAKKIIMIAESYIISFADVLLMYKFLIAFHVYNIYHIKSFRRPINDSNLYVD